MLVELALSVAIVKVFNYLKDSDSRKLKNKFKDIMEATGIKNKEGYTFKINKTINTFYGYKVFINIPNGLSVQNLEDKKNILEDNLNSLIQINKNPFKNSIEMYLVNRDISKFLFEPVKQDPNQIYIGKDIKGSNYLIDLNKFPMLLICGLTGQGKTMLLSSILTNIIYNCSKGVELWFTQLIKGELHSFDDCGPVKFKAYNYDDVKSAICILKDKLDKRTELFKQHGIRNITQWNKRFKRRQMKRIILVCEEASQLIEYKELWQGIWDIVKAGRSVGIHLIMCMQRITSTNINTNVRSQMTKITFKQNNEADSKMTIGTKSAMYLKQGECIVAIDGEQKIKVPFIDDDFELLNKYVKDIRTPSANARQEVNNIKNNNGIIQIIETPKIIDIEEKDIKPIKRKGIVSLEEIENANRKR